MVPRFPGTDSSPPHPQQLLPGDVDLVRWFAVEVRLGGGGLTCSVYLGITMYLAIRAVTRTLELGRHSGI